jgi:hypothetical protein
MIRTFYEVFLTRDHLRIRVCYLLVDLIESDIVDLVVTADAFW